MKRKRLTLKKRKLHKVEVDPIAFREVEQEEFDGVKYLNDLKYLKNKIKTAYFRKEQDNFIKKKAKVHAEMIALFASKPREQQDNLFQNINPLKEQVLYDTQDKLFSDEYLYKTTDLTTEQIQQYFKVIIIDVLFYKKYTQEDSPEYNKYRDLFDELLRLSISKDRKSRAEAVELFRQVKSETEKMKESQVM